MGSIQTSRPYYHDSYRWSFEAAALEITPQGDHHAVVLDATYFYPTSGGQPNDLGNLGGRTVADVVVREGDGAIVHLVDGPVPTGTPLVATIDGVRRLDHMQQHTGQHVLSQAFVRLLDANTIGFHLGREYVSIDLDLGQLSDEQRDAAFALAAQVVRSDVPVRAWFPTEADLATIALRKTPEVDGDLRIVAIGDFDVSACGGTHVARTGEVGLIHCLKTERLKRGVRVSFLAGDRARADYADKQRIVTAVSATLACQVAELPTAVERIQGELATARQALLSHHEEALDREAIALASEAQSLGSAKVIRKQWHGRPVDDLKSLAIRLTAAPNVIALLATSAERTQFVFGRDEGSSVNLKLALDQALAAIGGGKGGGTRIVQGGGAAQSAGQVEQALDAAFATIGAP